MPAKKTYKISEDGVLRDATAEEIANLEQLYADNKPTDAPAE
jgi:hypothetical protein